MRRLLAVGLLAAAALSACSSDTDGSSGGATTGLERALASVGATTTGTQDEIQYGNLARERALGIIDPAGVADRSTKLVDPKWGRVALMGAGNLTPLAAQLAGPLGLNLYAADSAITAGAPPHDVILVRGTLDASRIESKLEGLGATKRTFGKVTGLSLGKDDEIDRNSPLAQYGALDELNQIVVDRSRFVSARNGTDLARALGGTRSLLDSGSYRTIGDCLGDVIAADIVAPDKPGNSTTVAAGVRDPGTLSGGHTEVLCLLPAAGKADAVKAALTRNLRLDAVEPTSNRKLSEIVSGVKIDTVGPLVRAVLTVSSPDTQPGFVFQALVARLYAYWDGTCTLAELRERRSC